MYTKTRIAPTPSGFLHLGNLYSFLLTAQLARKHHAAVMLRIDDMDRERVRPEYVQDIFDTLHFFDISWNEGPVSTEDVGTQYSQLRRLDLYTGYLNHLRNAGQVYACNCSRTTVAAMGGVYNGQCRDKQIPLDAPNVMWRLKTEPGKKLQVHTIAGGVQEASLPAAMTDFVVRKRDGFPAYQLCSVADDLHFGVDLIVRGQDLWESTLAQLYLADVLKQNRFQQIAFFHHTLINTTEGTKLSKSAGDTSLKHLRQQGLNRSEILNRLLYLLPEAEREALR